MIDETRIEIEVDKSKIKLISTYTEWLLKTQSENIRHLDTKHSAFLGFSALLLRFALNLPSRSVILCCGELPCNSCLFLKILVCILASISIFISALSLTAKTVNKIVDPKELLEEKFQDEEERIAGYIVSGWIQLSDQYDNYSNDKKKKLNYSIWFFSMASICFAVDIIIVNIYCK